MSLWIRFIVFLCLCMSPSIMFHSYVYTMAFFKWNIRLMHFPLKNSCNEIHFPSITYVDRDQSLIAELMHLGTSAMLKNGNLMLDLRLKEN